MSDVTQHPQGTRRWSTTAVVVAIAAGAVLTFAAAYVAGLPVPTRPAADSGYIVAHGLGDVPAGWTATVVASPKETTFRGIHTYNLAGIRWRDPQNMWHYWDGPDAATPVCLIPGRPVAATVGYIQVTVTDSNPGYRQAVYLHCDSDQPAR